MGVPGFYSWLVKRYPMIVHKLGQYALPEIDYLYLDMNGIIYGCVKDDSILFKAQVLPREFQQIWTKVFHYINNIVNLIKPRKMIFMGLDGVAPRSKMNNQRGRRFKSAKDHQYLIKKFTEFGGQQQKDEEFKNNSISPGTAFMNQLNKMLHFFIQRKIAEDDNWKKLNVIFTGSDCPGEGEHKIMEFIRANQSHFLKEDNHCLYGADADLIMLSMILPMPNILIIREEFIVKKKQHKISQSRKLKEKSFQIIFITILRQCFDIEYKALKDKMKHLTYSFHRIIKDFVLLFFFIGNDFLPRCMAFNIREKQVQYLIQAFKKFLVDAEDYVVGEDGFSLKELQRLLGHISPYQLNFLNSKLQESDKYLKQNKDYQSDSVKMVFQRVKNDSQLLHSLKQLYVDLNQQNQLKLKREFYISKFQIDPTCQATQFWNLLAAYTQGIKFVFEYYFINLPSWSWYYPYYFSPLLSDLRAYLANLVTNNIQLPSFPLDQPNEPFKQLLCILPKQSSALLPSNFAKFITDIDSPLRSPFDFYPDNFEQDLFGSVRTFEAIPIIPFLDQEKVSSVYEKGIKELSQQELERNSRRMSRLYLFDPNEPEIMVESQFKHIKSFKSNIAIREVKLTEKIQLLQLPIFPFQSNLASIPTLGIRKFEANLKSLESGRYELVIELNQEEDKNIKVGSHIFYGFPLEHSGQVEATISANQLTRSRYFNEQNYNKKNPGLAQKFDKMHGDRKKLFEQVKQVIKNKFVCLESSKVQKIAFIVSTKYFSRRFDGSFARVYSQNDQANYQIMPMNMVSCKPYYRSTKVCQGYSALQDQFPLHSNILVTSPDKYLGYKGKVIGYSQNGQKVKVQIRKGFKEIQQSIIKRTVNTNDVFFNLHFVAQISQIKLQILLTIFGSIAVQIPKDNNLPEQIDIGLNYIDRQQQKIVPNLVRINFDNENIIEGQKIYKFLEVSLRGLEILLEYKERFPQVIKFIKKRHRKLIEESKQNNGKIQWDKIVLLKQIYNETKSIIQVYLWLIEKEEAHLPLFSIYSKQILAEKVKKLQAYFEEELNKPKWVEYVKKQIDPNFLFSSELASRGYLHLQNNPDDHAIGDQVICLKPTFFGEFGVIIGIDNVKYEVLFDHPSFGKYDLGGLCPDLWGGRFKFRELLNIEMWPRHFLERFTKEQVINKGWIQNIQPFKPKFNSKPIKNFHDFFVIAKSQKMEKKFSPEFVKKMKSIKEELENIKLEQDSRKVDQTNKMASTSEQKLKKSNKNQKWVQKPKKQQQPHIADSQTLQKIQLGEQKDAEDILS